MTTMSLPQAAPEAGAQLFSDVMLNIRTWLTMPLDKAKVSIVEYMDWCEIYEKLDYDLVALSETAEEAIGLVFGV